MSDTLVRLKDEEERVLKGRGKTREARLIFDPQEAYRALKDEKDIALDIETSGLSPWKDKIAVVSLHGRESGDIAVLHTRAVLPECIKELLSQPGRTLTGHNVAGFDALFLHNAGVDVFAPKWFDTLIAELCAVKTGRRDVRVNLQASAKRRLGITINKDIDHRTWMQPTLTEEQLAYAAGDVRHLFRLADEQRAEVAGTEQERAMAFEMELLPVIMRMVLNGLPFSETAYAQYVDELTYSRITSHARLLEVFGDINFRSAVQLKKALAQHGINLSSTAHDKLVEISSMGGKSGEIVDVLLEFRGIDQRLKMYSSEWLDKYVVDARIHPKVWQCATDTGRMSNSEPNLQQVPKDDARKLFEAPEGWQIISADYSQIEVRVAAYYARDAAMLEALSQEDLHTAVASGIFGKPADQISSDERKLAKASTFTLLFGGGSGRLYEYASHNGSTITEEQARRIVIQFFNRFQGLRDMRGKAFARANAGKPLPLVLPTGLKRLLVGASLSGMTILNTLVQGTAAAGLKYGMLEAGRRGLDKYLGAVVHDELVSCAPANEAREYANELVECMLVGMAKVIPNVPVKVGLELHQTWGGHVLGCSCSECAEEARKKAKKKAKK